MQMRLDVILTKNVYRLMHKYIHGCVIDMYTVIPITDTCDEVILRNESSECNHIPIHVSSKCVQFPLSSHFVII